MNTEYDFTQTINTQQLLDEINTSGIPCPDYIYTSGTSVQIFYITPLTSGQLSTLTTVIANHVANPSYITVALQVQINKLVAYLNSSNATTANTARAIMVLNLAPKLPIGLLTTINAQILAIVGS